MNSRTLSYLAVGVFLLLGSSLIAARYLSLYAAQSAREDSRWRLSYDIEFESFSAGDELRIALPFDTPYCQIIDDDYTYPGLRPPRKSRPLASSKTRELWVSARQPAAYGFMAAFDLRLSPRADLSRQLPLENLVGSARDRYLRDEPDVPTQSIEVGEIVQKVPDEGTDAERVQWIFNHCVGLDGSGASSSAKEALVMEKGTPLAKARAMAALCRAIRIPARLVTGFEIKQGADVKPHVWVEVFQGQRWVPFDPENGYTFAMPMQFVPVRRGGDTVIRPTGVEIKKERYSVIRTEPPESLLQNDIRRPVQIFNLQRLPVPIHNVMKILLLLPFAALITALVRNVIGIRTFGTFSPALLAMSFIYADWETGLAILVVVGITGLVARTFLDRLRLLMVPRLSVMLTTVILCIVFGVSLLDYMEVTPGADAVLLPMVILTNLLERFYVTTEEDGLMFTMKLAAGTLLVATLCYLILVWDRIGEFILVYPEAHFFTIAVFILLGRYAGYRLTELWRFRELVVPTETRS
jgi:hypothetical protein